MRTLLLKIFIASTLASVSLFAAGKPGRHAKGVQVAQVQGKPAQVHKAGAADLPPVVKDHEIDKFNTFLEDSYKEPEVEYVIAKVEADWCAPCHRFNDTVLAEVHKNPDPKFKKVKIMRVDATKVSEKSLISEFGVQLLPSFIIFAKRNGKFEQVHLHVGMMTVSAEEFKKLSSEDQQKALFNPKSFQSYMLEMAEQQIAALDKKETK